MPNDDPLLYDLQKDSNFEIEPCDSIDFDDDHLQKLELSTVQKSQISFLWSQIPTLAAANAMAHAYVVKLPEGIYGPLMRYKNGGVGAAIMGNNGIIAHASFHAISIQAALLEIFSVMSIATGQYFLTQINREFKLINQKIDKVIDFLYGDKKAELISEISFVQDAYKNFNSIMSHETHRIATIVGLQKSKKVAMKDIEFYLCDLDSKANSSVKSYSEFKNSADEAFQIRNSLELSMQLYVMSSIMETYYAQNNDPDYISTLKDDMTCYVNKCEKRVLSCFSKMNGRNCEFKPTPIKKVDTSFLDKKFNDLLDALNSGEFSSMTNTIHSALNFSSQPKEYYLNEEGDVYIKQTM